MGATWTLDDNHNVTGIEEITCRLYGVEPRLKRIDVAREIKVKNICGSNVDLRPGVSIDPKHNKIIEMILIWLKIRLDIMTTSETNEN